VVVVDVVVEVEVVVAVDVVVVEVVVVVVLAVVVVVGRSVEKISGMPGFIITKEAVIATTSTIVIISITSIPASMYSGAMSMRVILSSMLKSQHALESMCRGNTLPRCIRHSTRKHIRHIPLLLQMS
jgi:hypothetical protein